jgi:integrase
VTQLAAAQLQDLGHNPKFVARTKKEEPKIAPLLQAKAVLDALGRDILSDDSAEEESRDRLVAETSLYTGMRCAEVAHLTVDQILILASEMEAQPLTREFHLLITKTKGSHPGYVIFPKRLVTALLRYVETERAAAVENARARCGESYRDPGTLFVNGIRANDRDIGRQMSSATISRAFSQAVLRCGWTVEEERFQLAPDGSLIFDEITGKPLLHTVLRPAHTFHDLRHTFAVVQYSIRNLRGDKNPLATVKTLLRHKLSQTTADIYLSWLHLFERQLSEKLSDLYFDLDAATRSA